MKIERWFKKDVSLVWNGHVTRYAVAQELFSSHDVDTGSKALLRSLHVDAFPLTGMAADLGCGYGVLGLAWKDRLPDWSVELIDRDALAVAFSRRNASRFANGVKTRTGLGVSDATYDLILWNVPGKAGAGVLPGLARDTVAVLNPGGMLALVVVHPLVDVIREGLPADGVATVEVEERHADHTVMHIRRHLPAEPAGDPFGRGRFDRDLAGFGVDDFDYDIVPVTGLPEYDSYSYATQMTFDVLRTVKGTIASAMIVRPGQGHVPVVVTHSFSPTAMVLVDRDVLALRASERAMRATGQIPVSLGTVAAVDLCAAAKERSVDLCVLMLEEQVRNEVHVGRLDDLAVVLREQGQVVVGGTSSTVSRFLAHAAKAGCWKTRDRTKRHGASAARLEYTGPA